MSAAAEAVEVEASPWLIRPYQPESADDEALYYMLGITYSRSRAGIRAGAERAGRPGQTDLEAINKQRAFMGAHRPVWTWLLQNAEITLAVDPESPQIIWAWLITSGPVVLHSVGAKRSAVEAGIAQDIVRDLLGDRFDRHQVCTLELPQMRTQSRTDHVLGIDRPREWSLDPTWLLTRMVGR